MPEKMHKRICAIALASGLSRRMGDNKLLLPFREGTLAGHTLKLMAELPFSQRMVVTCYPKIEQEAQKLGIQTVWNPNSTEGISSSIRLGVENSSPCDGWIFLGCDQPRLSAVEVERLLQVFDGADAIVRPRAAGKPVNPCVFPYRFRRELLALRGDVGGKQILQQCPDEIVWVNFHEIDPFLDVDTPEMFARLQKE